ncbi:MAG: ribonuclease III [Patescibacteria group bacterium]|jgi:ribonuclease-3|nr:ribonuclease III [Patescibacteria group bacterium]
MKDFEKFSKELGIKFKNINLLITALTHRSYLNEHQNVEEHNERLEFLGDAVLELVVTEYLYRNFKNPEGDLTNWRSALVKTETISEVSKDLDAEDYILMSKGESRSLGRSRQLILANAFEAIIGAIFLDQGIETAKEFIEKNLIIKLDKILQEKLYVDPKSLFQELVQDKDGVTPTYEVLEEVGPDHDKTFTIGVFVGDKVWGKGVGPSKQAAQQSAAIDAVEKYQKNNN